MLEDEWEINRTARKHSTTFTAKSKGLFLTDSCRFAICEKAFVGFLELLLEYKVWCLTKYKWPAELCGAHTYTTFEMAHNTLTILQLESRRVVHKFRRTLSH